MNMKSAAEVIYDANKRGMKDSAIRRAGSIFNDRIEKVITPKLPFMAKGYAREYPALYRFILANMVSVAAVKFGSNNDKLMKVVEASVMAASDEFLGSFNMEETINSLIDGIDVDSLTEDASAVNEAAETRSV